MELDYSQKRKLCVTMMKYINEVLVEYPDKLTEVTQQPWIESLFKTKSDSTRLTKFKSNIFHTYVMKLMFLLQKEGDHIYYLESATY